MFSYATQNIIPKLTCLCISILFGIIKCYPPCGLRPRCSNNERDRATEMIKLTNKQNKKKEQKKQADNIQINGPGPTRKLAALLVGCSLLPTSRPPAPTAGFAVEASTAEPPHLLRYKRNVWRRGTLPHGSREDGVRAATTLPALVLCCLVKPGKLVVGEENSEPLLLTGEKVENRTSKPIPSATDQ